jgi:hypothetical protein
MPIFPINSLFKLMICIMGLFNEKPFSKVKLNHLTIYNTNGSIDKVYYDAE